MLAELLRVVFEFIGGLLLAIFGWKSITIMRKIPVVWPKVFKVIALVAMFVGFSLIVFSIMPT